MDQPNIPVGRGAAANAYLQRMNERQNNNNNIINNARRPLVDEDDLSNSDSDSNNNNVESNVRDNNNDYHPEEEEEEVLQPDAAVVQQAVYPPAAAASRRTTTKKRGKGKKIVSSAEVQPIRPAHVSMPPQFPMLKESDIKGASKQKSGQKTVIQVNQDRAEENKATIIALQNAYKQVYALLEQTLTQLHDYGEESTQHTAHLNAKMGELTNQISKLENERDKIAANNDNLKQQLNSAKREQKVLLECRDDVVKMLKVQIKELNATIASYRDTEAVEGRAMISVNAAMRKAQNAHDLKENNKAKKNQKQAANTHMVQSEHAVARAAEATRGSYDHLAHAHQNQQYGFMVCLYAWLLYFTFSIF